MKSVDGSWLKNPSCLHCAGVTSEVNDRFHDKGCDFSPRTPSEAIQRSRCAPVSRSSNESPKATSMLMGSRRNASWNCDGLKAPAASWRPASDLESSNIPTTHCPTPAKSIWVRLTYVSAVPRAKHGFCSIAIGNAITRMLTTRPMTARLIISSTSWPGGISRSVEVDTSPSNVP